MFVHLDCHSHYSFLRAVPSPDGIIAAAVEASMPAVALTDTNGMYAAIPFFKAAHEKGIKPIIGVKLEIKWREKKPQDLVNAQIVLLAENAEGYSNLCRLVTLRQMGTVAPRPKTEEVENEGRPVKLEELAQCSKGVIALASPRKSETNNEFGALKELFGDRLYLAVQRLSPGDGRLLREAECIGKGSNIPLVATNNVHFLKPEEHLHHRAMNAIRVGGLLTTVATLSQDPAKAEITTGEAWFKPYTEMKRMFPDHPELLSRTLEIVDRCNLELKLGGLIVPEFPVPPGETPFSYLWKLCFEGAQKIYKPLTPEVLSRLTTELNVIEKKKLAAYFLLVWDIVEEAKRRGIPAVARGSAASSMVTYALGISRVCPLRWGLYFERFLNVQRGDCPDIDIDICGARRDELLDYVYERWGEHQETNGPHVAMIGSFVTMHARLAIREIAKVFGVPPMEVNRFTKRLPHRPVREILQAIRSLPQCRDLPVDEEPWKTILDVALKLDDAPRHLGIHPCGTVIAARPLTQYLPLERAAKGIIVTQYDMNAVEALGLIKMDLLGQRGFTTMSLALDNIEKQEVKEVKEVAEKTVAPDGATPLPNARVIDFDAIPENDPETCEVIASGKTLGIFQIESPAMRGMLRMIGSKTLEQVAIALAIIRPGAAEFGSKELFVKRLTGKEKTTYAHPKLEPILSDTLGVCVYQEQVMQIAQAVGELSLAEADIVRRTSVKYSGRADYERLRGKFEESAGMMGLTPEQRKEAWMMVEKFAGFGFCKAHAATYADISYRMAFLKTHHPAEFLAAMCSAGAGFYHVSAYVEETKRWGIEVLLPSVNHSRMEYTVELRPGGKKALRIGLMQVRGLSVETLSNILRARKNGDVFTSLQDFLARVPIERDEVEALIKCGAFDGVGDERMHLTRSALLWQWNFNQAQKTEPAAAVRTSLFGDSALCTETLVLPEETPDYTREQKLRYERELLEVCVSGHPLDFLPRNGELWSDELPMHTGKRVTLCGWAVTHRHVGTKNYRNMMFLTLEDQRGLYEAVLFPDVYNRYGGLVYETRTLKVTGRVEPNGQLNCESLAALKPEKH
ncbi:MAG TPA: DNA polymerase III subunit alpha [Candidatus Acidoferrum sp.]|nr:DNA polymerase III subunit alpha [Candidatus Acidoferrum sp.]